MYSIVHNSLNAKDLRAMPNAEMDNRNYANGRLGNLSYDRIANMVELQVESRFHLNNHFYNDFTNLLRKVSFPKH